MYCTIHVYNINYIQYTCTVLLCRIRMLLTKMTAAQNEVALSYHRVRGLYSSGNQSCGNYS